MVVRDIAVANPPGCVGECFRVRAFDKLAYPLVDLPSQLSFSDPFGNIALRAERGVLAVARRVLPL